MSTMPLVKVLDHTPHNSVSALGGSVGTVAYPGPMDTVTMGGMSFICRGDGSEWRAPDSGVLRIPPKEWVRLVRAGRVAYSERGSNLHPVGTKGYFTPPQRYDFFIE